MADDKRKFVGDGIVLFSEVAQAMKGEKVLRSNNFDLKLIAPPPELRMGCDLAVEVNLVEKYAITRVLNENKVTFTNIAPLKVGTSEFLDVVKVTDFGQWTMVKSGNMKLTYEKSSGLIVNISGGGCPDIPYLNLEMVDKTLDEAPLPKNLGYTLCATMLQRAYDEAVTLHAEGK
ncbi:MAG: DUF3343 domain-containing protein [Dehalococcoidales bacterium]|nr:DUF3343 domain-containing protein [Dehalococcoidales bacterium]